MHPYSGHKYVFFQTSLILISLFRRSIRFTLLLYLNFEMVSRPIPTILFMSKISEECTWGREQTPVRIVSEFKGTKTAKFVWIKALISTHTGLIDWQSTKKCSKLSVDCSAQWLHLSVFLRFILSRLVPVGKIVCNIFQANTRMRFSLRFRLGDS